MPNLTVLTQTAQSQTNPCIAQLSYLNNREKRAKLKLNDTFFFSEIFHHINVLKKPAWFSFSGKEATNLMYPLHEAILSLGNQETVTS